jgi:acetylornithine deacetylase/succinyl-diaminopimelate desuccinylase-like protein
LNAISLAKAAFDLLEFRVNRYVHPDMGQSVCNLAAIDGGLEKIREGSRIVIGREGNNIPNICHVVIEARTTMEELDAFELITIYKNLIREGGGHFKMEKLRHNFGSFFSKEEDLKLIKKAAREVCGSAFYGDISQAGYYDAQLLLEKQPMPCAIFGPGPKLAAHQKDEHVSIESLDKTARTYKRLMELCGVI